MKLLLILSLVSASLISGIVEKKDGTYIEIYAKKSSKSSLIATVATHKGKLSKKFCSDTSGNGTWCKVQYVDTDVDISGYIDKFSLMTILSTPKQRSTYETSFGGSRDDVGKSIIPLKDGALIVGYSSDSQSSRDDAYVLRVDNYGNKIFDLTFGGERDDVLKDVIEIDDGFMVAGTSRSFGNGRDRVYLARISNNGKIKWHNGYNWEVNDNYRGNAIIKTDKNNFLVAGSKEHKIKFSSQEDCFLNSVNIDGTVNSIKSYGGTDMESASSIASVDDGYVFAGFTESWGAGEKDVYVTKTNKNGDKVWQNTFGFKQDEVANQIISTQDDGFIIVGTTESFQKQQKDIFVVKITAKGTKEWMKHYGTQEDEEGFGIVEVNDGYLIAGYTKYTRHYDSDVRLLKIDKTGNVMFTRQYGGNRNDKALAIAKLSDGFLVTGYTGSAETYSKDVYLLKVDMNGKIK